MRSRFPTAGHGESRRADVHLVRPGGAESPHAQFLEEIGARVRWIGTGRLLLTVAAAGAVVVGGMLLMKVPDPTVLGREAVAEARAAEYVPVTAPEFRLIPLGAGNDRSDQSLSAEESTAPGPRATAGVGTVIVHVAGAVREPGVFVLDASARVVDAVRLAGGPTAEAELDAINLAAPVVDGQRVRIPTTQEVSAGWVADSSPSGTVSTPGARTSGAPALVDLNTASAEELATLPGIGPVTAAAIVADRAARGPFRRVDDLTRVRGIGAAKVAGLRAMARVG